ncbi:MAG: exodeoxyribonuclease VII small subunit [Candidatus Electrothrix communis]|nr:exodeoxyribonuclease VII small subunit [Desulfobulbus sp. US4]WLE95599.1 MAG: exodeoxyribonuclease VII small subunit [Candidatus Electrothrix communis]
MAKRTFENALTKLDRITAELEQGDLGLDNSLKKFDEGVQLVKFCNEKLEEARSQVDLLLKKNDTLTTVPFSEETTEVSGSDQRI